MSWIKLSVLVGLIGMGLYYLDGGSSSDVAVNSNGFTEVTQPREVKPGEIAIISPRNCPKTPWLAARLDEAGVPYQLLERYSFEAPADAQGLANELYGRTGNKKMVVIIDGLASGNPSLDQVLSQYKVSKITSLFRSSSN